MRTARRLRRSLTPQEVKAWVWLREHGHLFGGRFRRQVPVGPYIVDFACLNPRIAIEIDGDSHCHPDALARDGDRDAFLRTQGFAVVRIWNTEIGRDADTFLDLVRTRMSPETLAS
ncbi:DUF559 domain-containing protein [Chthonobacter rhizosphaerae]|uniref:DUF559 domain-containing protein n=1 Tax=Chthonobacter rhizosphaerae TaxID=2735553 RepID=UPI0015EF78B4